MQSIWREPMQSIFWSSKRSNVVDDATLNAFLQESGGQLEYLFKYMPILAENPTPENIIAIVEIYIQMNRVISSISLAEEAHASGATIDEFAKYHQSIDPTLNFLSQVQQDTKYIGAYNTLKKFQRQHKQMRESIPDKTAMWIKQHVMQISEEKQAALVSLVNSVEYRNSVACLEKSKGSDAAALVLMLRSLNETINNKDYPEFTAADGTDLSISSKTQDSIKSPVADYYLEMFAAIAKEDKYPKAHALTGYANSLYSQHRDQLLQWMQEYMKFQLINLGNPKPGVSKDRSFLHNYDDMAVLSGGEQNQEERIASIAGLFLSSVQYNVLREHLAKSENLASEDITYIMRKLVLPRHSSMLVQEFTVADMKFLLKQSGISHVEGAAQDIEKMLSGLDKGQVAAIATSLESDAIASLANTLGAWSEDKEYGKVYGDLKLWVAALSYLVKQKSDSLNDSNFIEQSFESEPKDFPSFWIDFNVHIAGAGRLENNSKLIRDIKGNITPYAVQTTSLYNSESYGEIPVAALGQVLLKSNLPQSLFTEIVVSVYIDKSIYYNPNKIFVFDMLYHDGMLSPETLFEAIAANNIGVARSALEYNPRLLTNTNADGLTPLKAAVMAGDLYMVKLILSRIIKENKQLEENIPLPLQFAIDNGKQDVANFFADKLGLSPEEREQRGVATGIFAIPAATESLHPMEDLARDFRAEYVPNTARVIGDFLCKISCVATLLWFVAAILGSSMYATIFAYMTCIPLLVTAGMYTLINSLSFKSIVDSFGDKLGYSGPGAKGIYSPEMISSYITNVMPKVNKQLAGHKESGKGQEIIKDIFMRGLKSGRELAQQLFESRRYLMAGANISLISLSLVAGPSVFVANSFLILSMSVVTLFTFIAIDNVCFNIDEISAEVYDSCMNLYDRFLARGDLAVKLDAGIYQDSSFKPGQLGKFTDAKNSQVISEVSSDDLRVKVR